MQDFINFVARVMEIDSSEINEDTAYGQHEKWDSLMHMRLVMEIEEEYGVNISSEEFLQCQTIGDLYKKCVKD